jgi:hypothetical protein
MLRQSTIEPIALHARPDVAVAAVGFITAITFCIILAVVVSHS